MQTTIQPPAMTPPGLGSGERRDESDSAYGRMALIGVALVLRYRRIFIVIGLVMFGMMVVPKLVGRRMYTVEAAFITQERSMPAGGLASLAAQFGVALPTNSAAESPAFYASLITSRGILSRVVETQFPLDSSGRPRANLIDVWEVPGPSRAAQVENAVRLLRESMTASTSLETGAVRLRVLSRNPILAAAIAQRILDLVNDFNVSRRQSQAGAERRFVDDRLKNATAELAEAEGLLQSFLQRNRQIENSPQLQFEHDRLERAVSLRQQIVNSLAQSYEQARISEARNVAIITVIEPPVAPASPNRRGLVLTGLKALAIAFVLSALIALVLEVVRGARERRDRELDDLAALWRETLKDLRHPTRMLRRSRRAA